MTQTPRPDSDHHQSDPAATAASASFGLIVINTEAIRSFLLSAASGWGPHLSPESAISPPTSPPKAPSLTSPFEPSGPLSQSDPVHPSPASSQGPNSSSPAPSRGRSEELKARLRKLEELAERKAYAERVKDITPKKGMDEPLSSYKDQIGFGIHVMLIIFTGYLVGYAAFRAMFNHSAVMTAAGGS